MPFIKPKKEENIQRVSDFIQALKGDTGPEGYTPVKGVDYLTDEELALIKKESTPVKGIDYNDGKEGAIGPRGNQGVKGDRGDSIVGPAGNDGKDGSPDAPEDIVTKLNTQEDAVEIKVIKGLKKRLDGLNNQPIPASIRIRAKINGVEQNEPVGSINFPTGTTRIGQDYTVGSGSSGVAWGGITGTLSNQTDLQSALDLKAPLASPTFTGTVTTPALTLSTFTAGSVLFAGTGGAVSQDNAKLFYDDTNDVLMLNTNTGSSSTSAKFILKNGTNVAVRGTEVILNAADRDFSSDTGNWTGTNWTIGGGVATHTVGANTFTLSLSAITPIVSGTAYRVAITFAATNTAPTTVAISLGGQQENIVLGTDLGSFATTVSYVGVHIASSTATLTIIPGSVFTGSIDTVSITPYTTNTSPHITVIDTSSASIVRDDRRTGGVNGGTHIGAQSGEYTETSLSRSFAFGTSSLRRSTTGTSNLAIGNFSLGSLTTGSSNTAIGSAVLLSGGALGAIKTGSNNLAIGNSSGNVLTTGQSNVFIGLGSAPNLNGGEQNTFIGRSSGSSGAYANYGVMVGASSGDRLTATTLMLGNIGIGYQSYGTTNSMAGDYNIAIGYQTLGSNVTSTGNTKNIAVGYQTCTNLQIGASNNITIGNSLSAPIGTGSYQLNIGNIIFGTGITGTGTTIAGKIGIGLSSPTARFEVKGSGSTSATQSFAVHNSTGTSNSIVTLDDGSTGFGVAGPTATNHIKAGTATAGTAPLKLTAGVTLTTPEAGAVEFDGTHFYGTVGSTRYQLDQQSGGSGTVTSVTSADANITVATTTTTPVITLVQAPALKSATTTIDVASATAPTTGQVLTATGASAATWQTPSSSSATMATFVKQNQDYTTDLYTLWTTTPVISTGTVPTMDSNGSLLLPVSTIWKITFMLDMSASIDSAGSLRLIPFITNTSTGTTNSTSGSAVITPTQAQILNGYFVISETNLTITYGTSTAVYTIFVKVGTVAKYLRFDGSATIDNNVGNFQELTVEKIA